MSERTTRTIQIALPGGKATAESVAHIIDTIFTKGLEHGERVDSIKGYLGTMGETLNIDFVISAPAEPLNGRQTVRDIVDDHRR